MPIGHKIGLVSDERYNKMIEKYNNVEKEINRLEKTNIAPSEELNKLLESRGTSAMTTGCKLADLIRRPQLNYAVLKDLIILLK